MANRFSKFLRDVLPRTGRMMTERGTYVNEADIIEGLRPGSDSFGNSYTAEYTPVIERKPLPALSPIRDNLVGAGTAATAGGEINIDATAGLTTLYTRDYGRYVPGTYGIAGIGVRFETPGTGTYEYGYGNGEGNRLGMEVINGEYYTFIESNGDRYYRKPRAEWLDPLDGNGPSGLMLNEGQHVFRMKIGWYGYLSVSFYIAVFDRVNGESLVLIDRSQERIGVNFEQPDLPIFAEATGGILHVGGRQYGVMGRYRPSFRVTSGLASSSGVGSTYEPICSFRVKNAVTWRGVPTQISGITALCSSNSDLAVIIGGTLTGAVFGNVPNIDPGETALEFDQSATAITGGYLAYAERIPGGSGNSVGRGGADIPDLQLPRDQVVTLVARAIGTTTDVDGALRIREEW